MKDQRLVTLKIASRILRAPPYRIIHLCESDVVRPAVEARGRGTFRKFSADDLFMAAVALRLQDSGLTVKQIVHVREAFDWLARGYVLKEEVREGGLIGAILSLTPRLTADSKTRSPRAAKEPPRPVLLHVALSNIHAGLLEGRQQSQPGRRHVAIECPQPPALPDRPKISFHTDDRSLAWMPTRLVVNLTKLCMELRGAMSQPR